MSFSRTAYDLKPVTTPILHGMSLRLTLGLLENPWTSKLCAPLFRRGLGIEQFRAKNIPEPPTVLPLHAIPNGQGSLTVPPLTHRASGFRFRSICDFHYAYKRGVVTPDQVAERVLSAIATSDLGPTPLRAFISCDRDDVLLQARRATRRYREGCALGPLDGVPIAVKDEVDMAPYRTTKGTRVLGSGPTMADATVVARLRAVGALLIGKTNMHEFGLLPDGVNPHFGAVRNPYHPSYETGGSSSGSAAAVAAGLCPAAIGADGGGSIRIPAAFCGVVGLKPTFGRVTELEALSVTSSVVHLGPIGATAVDAALVYSVIAGLESSGAKMCPASPAQVASHDGSLNGLRIGIFGEWFSDADPSVVAACRQALQQLVRLGATLVEVNIPGLSLIRVAHGLIIHSEIARCLNGCNRDQLSNFSLRTRLMLANIRQMPQCDLVQAQRVRTQAIKNFLSALSQVDVIATPTTPFTAPLIQEDCLPEGPLNIGQVFDVMRFVNPANLTGLPAMSIPAGYDTDGMPISLQFMARPWEEAALFRLAFLADGFIEPKRPAVSFDLLPELGPQS
jgi:Asp-tRNA(Asn)/Glu-tRNA(Gln) amidotransferase A subunit family amidase